MKLILTFAFILLIFASSAGAQTYHVNATGGLDSRTCTQIQTQSTPALTIQRGVDCVNTSGSGAGKTVLVQDGIYQGFALSDTSGVAFTGVSGSSGNPFMIKAANNQGAVIQAGGG